MRTLFLILIAASLSFGEKVSHEKLIQLAQLHAPNLEQTIRDTFADPKDDKIAKGTAYAGEHGQFLFVVAADQQPYLQIDQMPPQAATRVGNLWVYLGPLKGGTSYKFVWIVGGKPFYTATRPDAYRMLDAFDNLFAEKRIPLMANVFVEPGTAPERNIRSIEYDTVSDKFGHYLLEEVFPKVEKHIPLRHDAYSRALAGESSGGICAFNAAYLMPDQFSRVLSWIGSFAALQTNDAQPTGGAAYPVIVRREQAKRNIRVWMQDGADDQENPRAGSWPLANIELANSLKIKGYDYHFSFGVGTHSQRQGSAELPESLVWLWRDYDPAKITQEFTPEPEEKDKPLWRVLQMNR